MSKRSQMLAKYSELQPKNGSKFTPRLGYYLIQEVSEHATFIDFFIAKALWKENESDRFRDDVIVEIGTANLQESSADPTSFDPNSLVDQVIHVKGLIDDTIMFKGEETPFVKCDWEFDNSPIVILKAKPSFLDMLRQDPTILDDAINDDFGDDDNDGGPDLSDDDIYDGLN